MRKWRYIVLAMTGMSVAGCERPAVVTPADGPASRGTAPSMSTGTSASAPAEARMVPVTITGGHETDPRDRGRPDVLVAAGLGVPTDVFREAFSQVSPAPAGQEPDPQQVQANKRALLDALSKYGVTNERLDEVSNMYRYPPRDPALWKHTDAVVKATVVNDKVTGFVVENTGAGYTSAPEIQVPGYPAIKPKITLHFGKDLTTNGSIESVTLPEAK